MNPGVIVALLVAVILAAISVGSAALSERFRLASETSQPATVLCVPDTETRDKVRVIMLEAIEQSLREHIVRMHEVWMKDDRGQPGRAQTGARQGIKAYIAGRDGALKWNPPLCP